MKPQIITIGDRIDLSKIVNTDKGNSNIKKYASQVLDFLEKGQLKISMPFETGKIIPLEKGDKYNMCFYTSKGLFRCNGVILDRYIDSKIPVLVVGFLSDLEKFQRREYYRMECVIDGEYRIISEEEISISKKLEEGSYSENIINSLKKRQEELKNAKWINTIINDLSGGGARMTSTELHAKEQYLDIKFVLEAEGNIINMNLKAHIIASSKLINKPGFSEHRIEFIDISNGEREKIIKFIFEEERRKRRKEKGYD